MHDGIPVGVSAADNELGTRMALDNLAALVESSRSGKRSPHVQGFHGSGASGTRAPGLLGAIQPSCRRAWR